MMIKSNKKWTLEKIKEGFEAFNNEFGHYPTAHDIDGYDKLPTSRQIQRAFGGLIKLREKLGLKEVNFTKGEYSSNRAHTINQRAYKIEKEVYTYLVNRFGVEFVHREYFFSDDRRTRTDFYVFYNGGNFSVDVFYPKNIKIVNGCINSKLSTYSGLSEMNYPTIFLMMNELIDAEQLRRLVSNKKNKLNKNQLIMTMGEFKTFCSTKEKRK